MIDGALASQHAQASALRGQTEPLGLVLSAGLRHASIELQEPRLSKVGCKVCDFTGWVCENHQDRPWEPNSKRKDACACGSGAPCPKCNRPEQGIPDVSGVIDEIDIANSKVVPRDAAVKRRDKRK